MHFFSASSELFCDITLNFNPWHVVTYPLQQRSQREFLHQDFLVDHFSRKHIDTQIIDGLSKRKLTCITVHVEDFTPPTKTRTFLDFSYEDDVSIFDLSQF